MILNNLVFPIKLGAKFVEGSIPTGYLTANDINKDMVYVISPEVGATNITLTLQNSKQSEKEVRASMKRSSITVDMLVSKDESYYDLIKDWNVWQCFLPSKALTFVSYNRANKIGISFGFRQATVPRIEGFNFIDNITNSDFIPNQNGYYINKTALYIYNGLELTYNDVLIKQGNEFLVRKAIITSVNTSTLEYDVDPSVYDSDIETIDIGIAESLILQANGILDDINFINFRLNDIYTKDETYSKDEVYSKVDTDLIVNNIYFEITRLDNEKASKDEVAELVKVDETTIDKNASNELKIAQQVLDLINDKIEQNALDGFVYQPTYDNETHTLTLPMQNKMSLVIDLDLERLIMNIDLEDNELVFTFEDGTIKRIPLGSLLVGMASEQWVNAKLDNYYNKGQVDGLLGAKVNKSDIVNNLTSTDTNKPLSANQGKVLNDKKADKTYVDVQDQILDDRIDNIIVGTVEGASAQEIIDARQGEVTLGANIRKVKSQLAETAKKTSIKVVAENITFRESNNITVHDMSDNEIYASYMNTFLAVSADEGMTFTSVYQFEDMIRMIKKLNNGKLLVSIGSVGGTNKVYLSGVNNYDFTSVLTNANGAYINNWGVSVEENIIALSEYGDHGKAQNVYLSTDYGQSFANVFNLGEHASNPLAAHTHGVIYDKFFERIWVISGDTVNAVAGTDLNNKKVFYSDDWGVSWKSFLPQLQLLDGYAFPDRVIFTSDQTPNGIYAYHRGRKEDTPHLELVKFYEGVPVEGLATYLSYGMYRRSERDPLLIGMMNGDVWDDVKDRPKMIWGTYDGENFFEVWKDDINHKRGRTITVVGPTNEGKLIATFTGDDRFLNGTLLEADLVVLSNAIINTEKVNDRYLNARRFGVTGVVDDTQSLILAIKTSAELGKTLYIPSDLTAQVERVIIENVNNIDIVCNGTIKIKNGLHQGGFAEALEFRNCKNINIDFINIEFDSTNHNQSNHKGLSFDGCENVQVRTVNMTSFSGHGIIIKDSKQVRINDVRINGNDSGFTLLKLRNSSDVRIDHIQGLRNLTRHSERFSLDIQNESNTDVIKNIYINAFVKGDARRGFIASSNNFGYLENIEIEWKETKGAEFNNSLVDEDYIIIDGVKNSKLKINVTTPHEDMSIQPTPKTAVNVSNFERSELDVDISNFNEGVRLTSLFNSVFNGRIENTYHSGLYLGELNDVTISVALIDCLNEVGGNYAGVVQFTGTNSLADVNFIGCKFGVSGGATRAVNLYNKPTSNVLFFNCDFRGWDSESQVYHTTMNGIEMVNNLGQV